MDCFVASLLAMTAATVSHSHDADRPIPLLLIRYEAPPLLGGSRYKLSKNSRFRRKNKGLLKKSVKLEQAAQSTDGSITVQPEMTMIGLLLNPTKADFSPEGLLPHESAMRP